MDLGGNQCLKFEWDEGKVKVSTLYKDRPQLPPGYLKLDNFREMMDTFEALEAKGERVTALVAQSSGDRFND
jgi:hypothetical protein